jgi:hypothetical protein
LEGIRATEIEVKHRYYRKIKKRGKIKEEWRGEEEKSQ